MAYSYHCLCSNFILTTIHDLSDAARRGEEAADRAYILSVNAGSNNLQTILQGGAKARDPKVVQREDGIEKRWVVNCDRCGLPVGYHLDWLHTSAEQSSGKKEGRREEVLYVLPGALVTTEEMRNGKRPPENDLKFKVARA